MFANSSGGFFKVFTLNIVMGVFVFVFVFDRNIIILLYYLLSILDWGRVLVSSGIIVWKTDTLNIKKSCQFIIETSFDS